jgi:hypothetical protein
VQLVTRTVPKGGTVDEPPDCKTDVGTCVENEASFTAALTLVAAIVGLFLGVFGVSKGPAGSHRLASAHWSRLHLRRSIP